MLQFFWNKPAASDRPEREIWCDDILRHPDITTMDERQRGDLPMPRMSIQEPDCSHMNGACRGGSGTTSM